MKAVWSCVHVCPQYSPLNLHAMLLSSSLHLLDSIPNRNRFMSATHPRLKYTDCAINANISSFVHFLRFSMPTKQIFKQYTICHMFLWECNGQRMCMHFIPRPWQGVSEKLIDRKHSSPPQKAFFSQDDFFILHSSRVFFFICLATGLPPPMQTLLTRMVFCFKLGPNQLHTLLYSSYDSMHDVKTNQTLDTPGHNRQCYSSLNINEEVYVAADVVHTFRRRLRRKPE